MARKTLLNESEIRRFMKLASISPLKEGYGMPVIVTGKQIVMNS